MWTAVADVGVPSCAGMSVHLETQREVAAAFNSLTLNDDNKGQIARHQSMGSLVQLCQSPDVECARHAIGAMANIAEDLSTHAIIGEKGGGAFLIGLMHHSNVDVHRYVVEWGKGREIMFRTDAGSFLGHVRLVW